MPEKQIYILSFEVIMEYFDIVDENGDPTGETVERSFAHQNGIRHRTAHVWLFRKENGNVQILLQKRELWG